MSNSIQRSGARGVTATGIRKLLVHHMTQFGSLLHADVYNSMSSFLCSISSSILSNLQAQPSDVLH